MGLDGVSGELRHPGGQASGWLKTQPHLFPPLLALTQPSGHKVPVLGPGCRLTSQPRPGPSHSHPKRSVQGTHKRTESLVVKTQHDFLRSEGLETS